MNKKNTILAALAMSVATATAGVAPAPVSTGKGPIAPPPVDPCAGPISYNNIEALYVYTDFEGGGDNGNGGRLNIEYSPMQNIYLTAGAEYLDYDYGNVWLLNAGIGGYLPLTDNIHLAGDAGVVWARDEYEVWVPQTENIAGGYWDDESDDEFGWYVRPHLRAKFGCLTIHAGAEYVDVGEGSLDGEWFGFGKLFYQVTPNWDVTAGVRVGDDTTQWSGGVRYRY